MDAKQYYTEVRAKEAELVAKFPNREVFVTSIDHREKNSIGGKTLSAAPYLAAKGIVDQTHRLATEDEIKAFIELQENNRIVNAKSEQAKRQQYIVVVNDPASPQTVMAEAAQETVGATASKKR